jgi:hypothetical protein
MRLERSDLPPALKPGELGERTRFCPDVTSIAGFFERNSARAEQDRLVEHLAACAYCRARLGVLARLAEDGGAGLEQAQEQVPEDVLARVKQLARPKRNPEDHRRQGQSRWWPAAAVAAVGVLAVGLFVNVDRFSGTPLPGADRTSPGNAAGERQQRSVDGSALEPRILYPGYGARLNRAAVGLRWTPVEGALHYEVTLLSDSGDLLLSERVQGTHWAPAQPPALQSGERYYLRVTARLADGRATGSGHAAFQVTSAEGDEG